MDPFVHLRVASGYSLRYGASHPEALVERAAEFDMDILALTDRDGLYGAVRFATACRDVGIAPVVGVDLAVAEPWADGRDDGGGRRPPTRKTAAKGGELRDPRLPRVVVTAISRAGWGKLCRLVTETHLASERGHPVADPGVIAEHASSGDLLVMFGSDSVLGGQVAAGDLDAARRELAAWRDLIAPDQLVVGVVNHCGPGRGRGSVSHAGAMLRLADEAGLTGVLANDVRMVDRRQAPTLDVLDATRRLVPLDARAIDRRNAEGYLKPGKQMIEVAEQVADAAGRGPGGAERLFADTRTLGIRARLDPATDIGLGEIHLPEFDVLHSGGALNASGSGEMGALRALCEAGVNSRYGVMSDAVRTRLDDELAVIAELGFASYFLTVRDIVGLIRDMGVRVAARGSGAGSLVNYLLGISGVDPMAYGLVMERFLSPLRRKLPDIDLDVESARRTDIYRRVLDVFGAERVACVAMIETYRVRHAVRDVGAALAMPPGEVACVAKAFPRIRARDARAAIRDLPELRAAGLSQQRFARFFELVESLDGLPRHVALHPCGVLLSDATLGDRTPLESSFGGFPMSQFDKDDVEALGLLKLDILAIRMQSAMSHALDEVARADGARPDIDALAPFDDESVYDMISHSQTLGCFQIESPGQRELVGKFGPSTFNDIIIDISLFRPGPVKSDMVIPFLNARQGWAKPDYLHPDLIGALEETCGVVVFHEQIIKIVAIMTGCSYAQADEVRRALGDDVGTLNVRDWFFPTLRARGYSAPVIERAWFVLESFAAFGFCKAHAAAFALPTYQSAWLKRYYPAAFIAGVLTHDPGMYPKRLLLEEARRMNIEILGVDVNESTESYHAVRLSEEVGCVVPRQMDNGLPDGSGWGIRLALSDVKGISDGEVARVIAGQPYRSLIDFWDRARVSAPIAERLILAGGFDSVHGIGAYQPVAKPDAITRRDLLLALADLARTDRVDARVGDGQLALPLDDDGGGFADVVASGLPEMTPTERLAAELEILGMDATGHVLAGYRDFLDALGVTASSHLLGVRNESDVLVAGVKVATQTPHVRSGRRVIFLTLDDGSGPVDSTFFEDVQPSYAATVFGSWLLVVRGVVRRTGPRGISLRALGAWDLEALHKVWRQARDEGACAGDALDAVRDAVAVSSVVPSSQPHREAPRKLWHSSSGSPGR